jgi:hypothetical protein
MPFFSVLRVNVNQAGAVRYERAVQRLAAAARADSDTFQWSARNSQGVDGVAYAYITALENLAELGTRETVPLLVRRLFGASDGDALLEELGAGVSSNSFAVLRVREDLSTAPSTPPAEPAPILYTTSLRVRPGGQPALEELIRRVTEAARKVGEERSTIVVQTAIGDMGEYYVSEPLSDLGLLDKLRTPQQALIDAFGEKEAAAALAAGTSGLEQVVTNIAFHRPDLSNGA